MARLEYKDAKKVTLAELKQMVVDAKDNLLEAASNAGRDFKVYWHWTAGWWNHADDDYHVVFGPDGAIYVTVDRLDARMTAHTYMRNTGAVSFAACACALATTNDLGENPPTDAQIESMAMASAIFSDVFEMPIIIQNFMTHGEAADNLDGYDPHYIDPTDYLGNTYGPDSNCQRWDWAITKNGDEWKSGGDTLRGKAIWYQEQYPDGVEKHF